MAAGTSIETARTVSVNMLVAGEVVYLLNCRRIYFSSCHFKILFGSRPILIWDCFSNIFSNSFYLPAFHGEILWCFGA